MRRTHLLCSFAFACKAPEAAPADLDGLLSFSWRNFDGTPTQLADGVVNLDAVVDAAALLEAHVEGTQSRLSEADQATVPLRAPPDDDGAWRLPDIANARPLFVLNRFRCDLDVLESILIDKDQDAIYDSYDAYERVYTSSDVDYLNGDTDRLSWEVTATASNIATGSYTELLIGDVRRVPGPLDRVGDALYARTYIPHPADTERENVSFVQDYQIEVYWPLDGDILHLYGIWREMDLGSLGTMESNGVAQITLTNMVGWDEKTAEACAAR